MVQTKPRLRGVQVWPRRNGKDLVDWNICIAKALQEKGLYFYMAPFYNQVRQIIWEGMDSNGRRFLDYIPKELVIRQTQVDMRVEVVNGSQIKLCGSDNIDSIVGTNPRGIVFTEFSLHKPRAWHYLRPILAENNGWALFNGTPRSYNHFFDLGEAAKANVDWFYQYLTRDDTGIPTLEAIEDDRKSGMPQELIDQEYYCSFEAGLVGAYYANALNDLKRDGRLRQVPWEPRLDVHTGWDLGVGDPTAIWFVQLHRDEIRVIDYYENRGEGLMHYIKVLREKPYVYGEHFAPHDIEVRELGSGISRKEAAEEMGLYFTTVPKLPVDEGIEAVRELLPKAQFDKVNTGDGFNGLLNYQADWSDNKQTLAPRPLHNWASHSADAMRTMAIGLREFTGSEWKRDVRILSQVTGDRVYSLDDYKRDRAWNARNSKRFTRSSSQSVRRSRIRGI